MALILMVLISNRALEAKGLEIMNSTRFLKVEGKALAYDDNEGAGPVVVCIPGFRVITLDPRGQGESEAFWDSYQARSTRQRLW